jgi:type VI secretion system protein ImpK
MSRKYGSSRGRRRPPERRDGSRKKIDFGDVDNGYDDYDDEYDEEDEPRSRRSRRAPSRGRPRGGRRERERSRSGGRGRASRGRRDDARFDWDAVDDEEPYDDEEESYEEESYDEPRRRRPRRRERKKTAPARRSLMELCTPVFGYAAVLPQDPDGEHPAYQQFRQQVVAALHSVENDAPNHGIEAEDARQACYALSLFMDTYVANSAWNAKAEWAGEPLGIMLHQDPEGGINFFQRLESFRDDQKDVREIYLVCLALGFRGKYAEMELNQQATQIAEEKLRLLRQTHPVPLEKQAKLFPAAYRPAQPITDEIPPPPRWWVITSAAVVVACLLVWVLLFWVAGRTSAEPSRLLEERAGDWSPPAYERPAVEPPPVEPAPAEPPAEAAEEGGA